MRTTDAQQIDLNRIRKFVAQCQTANGTVQLVGLQVEARNLAPMINELCDLVEHSDLLPSVEQARLDMQAQDDVEVQGVLDKLNLYSGDDPESILPREY